MNKNTKFMCFFREELKVFKIKATDDKNKLLEEINKLREIM